MDSCSSATGDQIYFMFDSRVGFWSADRIIAWRYFRFDQMDVFTFQDGSRSPSWKITATSRGRRFPCDRTAFL